MTIDEIDEIIAKNDHRLTRELAFSIAFQSAKKEREACAELCLQGTDTPMQTHALDIIKAERRRIANLIKERGRKSLKDLLIEDSPEFEACLCYEGIDCTDEQLMEEVRRRGFVIRDAQIGREWVGLTEADKSTAIKLIEAGMFNLAFKYLEEKLKEKNFTND